LHTSRQTLKKRRYVSVTQQHISSLALSGRFYEDIIRPLMGENFSGLPYAAALIGPGSEVLGFDTAMSRDHDWGARLFLFVREADHDQRGAIAEILSHRLPATFLDAPVHFDTLPSEPRTRVMLLPSSGPIHHRVIPITLGDFTSIQVGVDLTKPID